MTVTTWLEALRAIKADLADQPWNEAALNAAIALIQADIGLASQVLDSVQAQPTASLAAAVASWYEAV